jgi:hypothetical protein
MMARRGLAAQEGALEVDAHDAVEIGLGDIEEIVAMDDTGIVDEDVDVTEHVERRGYQIVHGEPVADIGADEAHLAERGQFLFGGGALALVDIGHGDASPISSRIAGSSMVAGIFQSSPSAIFCMVPRRILPERVLGSRSTT